MSGINHDVKSQSLPDTNAPSSSSSSLLLLLCQVCHKKQSQYTCPKCYMNTCSLQCCQNHKIQLKCNGQRDRTNYIRISNMNDTTILSDYHFLKDGTQQIETSRRLWNNMIEHEKKNGDNRYNSNANNNNSNNSHYNKKRPRSSSSITEVINEMNTNSTDPIHPILQAATLNASSTNTLSKSLFMMDVSNNNQEQNDNNNDNNNKRRNNNNNNNKMTMLFTSQNVAKTSFIHLLVLPNIMERHQLNQSCYKYINNNNNNDNGNYRDVPSPSSSSSSSVILHWTIEIKLIAIVEASDDCTKNGTIKTNSPTTTSKNEPYTTNTIVLQSIPETMSLSHLYQCAIEQLTIQQQSRRHPKSDRHSVLVEQFTGNNDKNDDNELLWFIKKIPCPADHPTYIQIATTNIRKMNVDHHEVHSNDTTTISPVEVTTTTTILKDVLMHTTIIEFPTIYIIPSQQYTTTKLQSYFPCMISTQE